MASDSQKRQSNPMKTGAAERFALLARQTGVPLDALERFIVAGYVPQPKHLQFHAAFRECDVPDGPTQVGIGGARGPGKSHAALAQVAIDDCQRVPGLKWLFLRKVGKAARESFEDLRPKVLMGVTHEYKRQEGLVIFVNDSRIILGHFKDESDVDSYLGLEYDGICIEESTQLSAKKHELIGTCLRTSKPNWRPRIYHTTNPGGPGHSWFKTTFIAPWRRGVETDTRFVFGTHHDNKFLNPEYVNQLNKLIGWLRAAWRDGEWDIAGGQFFTTWRYDFHVGDAPTILGHWPVWCSLDYGFTHPTVCLLFTENDGKRFVVDEYVAARRLPDQNVAGIKAMLERHGVTVERLNSFVAGPDVFAQKGDESGKTIADQYAEHGIKLTHANMDRINGAAEVLRALGDPENNIPPKILISSRSARLIECLPSLSHDPHRPEDVLKVDVDEDGEGGDDPYDALRYGLATPVQAHYSVVISTMRRSRSQILGFDLNDPRYIA